MWWQPRQQTSAVEFLKNRDEEYRENEQYHDCLGNERYTKELRKGTATSEHFGQMKYSMSVLSVSGTEIEKCMFCPMNSCLEQVIVKLTGYEHNYFIFSQFVWSWMTENMHNPRVNRNTIISRENTFLLWHCSFCQPFGLIIIYLTTHENAALTLTVQARNEKGAVQ